MPSLTIVYKSMNRAKKSEFRKAYSSEFDLTSQTFDSRRKSEFKDFTPAEKKWACRFLDIPREELFPETANIL